MRLKFEIEHFFQKVGSIIFAEELQSLFSVTCLLQFCLQGETFCINVEFFIYLVKPPIDLTNQT